MARVPVMIGMTSADAGITVAQDKDALFASFGPHGPALRAAYDPNGTAAFSTVRTALTGDQYMAEPARFVARHAARLGRAAYVYRFGYVAQSKRADWTTGAPHATDIPYFFDTVDARYGSAVTAQDRAAARLANRYVVNFVRRGDPNGQGAPEWPAYVQGRESVLTIDERGTASAAIDPARRKLDILEAAAVIPAR
jgi:para-nitrobenzyl esterase